MNNRHGRLIAMMMALGMAGCVNWSKDVDRYRQVLDHHAPATRPAYAATDPLGSQTSGLQSYDAIYADTRKWVKSGWLDYIAPQIYWHIGFSTADYAVLTPWWANVVAGTGVQLYIGQAAYRVGAAELLLDRRPRDRVLAPRARPEAWPARRCQTRSARRNCCRG